MNYIMENGTNFNSELFKAICETDDNDIEKCLITDDILEKNHVTLQCQHKFNYNAILAEVRKQKTKKNNLETQKLKKTQIKCPYCRKIQHGLLPYLNGTKIRFVNWPPENAYSQYKCSTIIRSGKRKGELCNILCLKDKCFLHNNANRCKAILKSGKNAGKQCVYKSTLGVYCKIHHKKT